MKFKLCSFVFLAFIFGNGHAITFDEWCSDVGEDPGVVVRDVTITSFTGMNKYQYQKVKYYSIGMIIASDRKNYLISEYSTQTYDLLKTMYFTGARGDLCIVDHQKDGVYVQAAKVGY